MADRMLTFPGCSSSRSAQAAPQTAATAVGSSRVPCVSTRYRGLFLVKGVPPPVDGEQAEATRLWRTEAIVAQVEREVAAEAARRRGAMLLRIHAVPSGVDHPAAVRSERETPWRVVARVVRMLWSGPRRDLTLLRDTPDAP